MTGDDYVTAKRLAVFDATTPAQFRHAALEDFDTDIATECRGWIHDPAGALVIYGPTGTGKTRLMYAVARQLVADGAHVELWPVVQLLTAARASFDTGGATDRAAAAARVDVLGLDDLGAERVTDWTRELLHSIIDARWQHARPTIATTNVTAEALSDAVGERATSRLWHNATLVGVLGGDRRRAGTSAPIAADTGF
ncbi:MAG TPA: ATP-binding protein [Acidimicrobiales bacterium]|nr:ATP-binding protein [Acidimicrobiales bacterium]